MADPIERANAGLHETLLAQLQELPRDAAILDVGCGSGAWLSRLDRAGFSNLSGIDYDTAQTVIGCATVSRVDMNEQNWSPLAGRFRLITAIEVIEHIENIGIFFDRLQHHLDDGGRILLTTPNIESLAARLRFLLGNKLKQFDELGDATHLLPLVRYTLPRILQRHGLRIVTTWGYPADGRTLTSRHWVNLLCAALRPFLREPIPGDNMCMWLERAA